MSVDYNALSSYLDTLNKDFKKITAAFTAIEKSLDNICAYTNWSGESREYFFSVTKKLLDDFEIVNYKFTNVSQYVDSAIDNYRETERRMGAIFGG